MIRFGIGLALLTLALIVGAFRFFENSDTIVRLEKQLDRAETTQQEARRLESRITKTKELLVKKGQDQLSAIRRSLELDKLLKLDFRFLSETSQAEQSARYFYQHTFEIEGPINFFDAAQLIDRIEATPGFTITQICFKCKTPLKGKTLNPDESMLTIRGNLYVYNDTRI